MLWGGEDSICRCGNQRLEQWSPSVSAQVSSHRMLANWFYTRDACPVGASTYPALKHGTGGMATFTLNLWGFISHVQGRKSVRVRGGTLILLYINSFGQRNLIVKNIPLPLLKISTRKTGYDLL